MKYFEILQCQTDPFPGFAAVDRYFPALPHEKCLAEILSVVDGKKWPMTAVLGAAGTGKTTIAFQLLERVSVKKEICTVLTDYSWFVSREKCIIHLAEFLDIERTDGPTVKEIEERLRSAITAHDHPDMGRHLLVIDQAEKIPYYCLEFLESLFAEKINSDYLQIVAFARPIFESKIHQYLNLVQNSHLIKLSQKWTFSAITGALGEAFQKSGSNLCLESLFTQAGRYYCYVMSDGVPGKALELCKLTLLNQIVHNCPKAGVVLCHQTAKEISLDRAKKTEFATISIVSTILVALVLSLFMIGKDSTSLPSSEVLSQGVSLDAGHVVEKEKQRTPVKVPLPVAAPQALREPSFLGEGIVQTKSALPLTSEGDNVDAAVKPSMSLSVVLSQEETTIEKIIPTNGHQHQTLPTDDLPELLGQISVFERETLGDMINRVYGPHRFTSANLARILKRNPQFSKKPFLNIGDIVRFPNMAISLISGAENRWWIRLITIQTLQDAYRYLRIYANESRPLRMIPSWGVNGFEYTIVVGSSFSSKAEAEKELEEIPSQVFPAAQLVDGLAHDSYLYVERPEELAPLPVKKRAQLEVIQPVVPVISTLSKKLPTVETVTPEHAWIPKNLGKLIMAKGDTLGGMIRGVYGKNSVYPKNIKWLVEHNKHLKNPNIIVPQTELIFPLKKVAIQENDEGNWWLQLGSYATLQEVYSVLRKHTPGKSWLLIIPTFTERQTTFALIVEKSYGTEAVARDRAEELSQDGFDPRLIAGLTHLNFYYKSKMLALQAR